MINRQKVYEKYDGQCAYCGLKIKYKDMQVDHLHPKCLSHYEPGKNINRFDNLMPSCRKCNIHKGGMRLKMWRSELGKQVERISKNAQFDRALRFGQIIITKSPIIFYFEENYKET